MVVKRAWGSTVKHYILLKHLQNKSHPASRLSSFSWRRESCEWWSREACSREGASNAKKNRTLRKVYAVIDESWSPITENHSATASLFRVCWGALLVTLANKQINIVVDGKSNHWAWYNWRTPFISKISSFIGALKRIRSFMCVISEELLFKSTIPSVDFTPLWLWRTQRYFDKLQELQKRATRVITRSRKEKVKGSYNLQINLWSFS